MWILIAIVGALALASASKAPQRTPSVAPQDSPVRGYIRVELEGGGRRYYLGRIEDSEARVLWEDRDGNGDRVYHDDLVQARSAIAAELARIGYPGAPIYWHGSSDLVP